MTRTPAAGGPGSNQYATKPGGTSEPGSRPNPTVVAAAAIDETPEDVAWVFHPDSAPWRNAGYTWTEAQPYLREGFTDPEIAKAWETITDGNLTKAGVWYRTGLWQPIGIWVNTWDDPYDAHQWYSSGFKTSCEYAKAQHDQGVSAQYCVVVWAKAGVPPSQIDAWIAEGSPNPEDAKTWIEAGFDPDEDAERAGEYRDGGITPDEAGKWNEYRLRAEDYKAWHRVGVYDPEIAADWMDACGSSVSDTAIAEYEAGLTLDEAREAHGGT